jgi:8-oxo-dGTP pyrophosphatase MutT (NUDIX family)
MSDYPGVTIWPAPRHAVPWVTVEDPAPEADGREVEAEWSRLTAANPRLFDGPILSFVRLSPERGEVVCRRDTYKRLAVRGAVETGVILTAVMGVLVARSEAGREHVLLGRRSPGTRVYPGMWELIPAGGLEPPPAGVRVIDRRGLLAQLDTELREEAGLSCGVSRAWSVAWYEDRAAHSFNVVFLLRPTETLEALRAATGERHWDCDETLWLPVDEAPRFVRERGPEIIDAAKAMMSYLRWA